MKKNTPHFSHPKYRPDIDGLRAIAVSSVVAFHAFPNSMKGGFIGVDIFFVISGYLISSIILKNLKSGTFSFTEFYARRAKRIFPALAIVLCSSLIFGWLALLPEELNQLGRHVIAGAGFVSNLVLWNESGYFDNSADTKPLLHLWSLGVEEQFYIFWPLALWLAWRKSFNIFWLTALAAFSSFALNATEIKQDPVATFYSPLTRFWELLCGTILAWYSLDRQENSAGEKKPSSNLAYRFFTWHHSINGITAIPNALSIAGLTLLLYGFSKINKELSFPGYWSLIPVLGAVLIISAGQKAWINRTILSSKPFVWIGLISFPLYLWHWPILSYGRIIYFDLPPLKFRVAAVAASVILAWITVKFVEKPFRFSAKNSNLKVFTLSAAIASLGAVGFIFSKADFSHSHAIEKLTISRKGEHAIGSSLAWYRGKGDWLFLGNSYDNTVAKLKLSKTPSLDQVSSTRSAFEKVAKAASDRDIRVALLVGPNKSSIYPEWLPDSVVPSTDKYSGYFLKELEKIPNLSVYDPTNDFLSLKNSEGLIYWMTDTHWNKKGAFLAYSGLVSMLNLPAPKVQFTKGSAHIGDLIKISKLENFPLHSEDDWDVVWSSRPQWTENDIPGQKKTPFGSATVSTNKNPMSNKVIWVVGDSFASALKPYFNATFKEVHYIGHWTDKLKDLPHEIESTQNKPDYIVIVRVERSF